MKAFGIYSGQPSSSFDDFDIINSEEYDPW
jgi:hypothetical protein